MLLHFTQSLVDKLLTLVQLLLMEQKLEVLDAQKTPDGHFIHTCKLIEGDISKKIIGKKAELSVDAARRDLIKANHSATHLVHSALREVLGDHVKQAGSRVDNNTLSLRLLTTLKQ